MRNRFAGFVAKVQAVIFAAHGLVFVTWSAFTAADSRFWNPALLTAFAVLSLSFVSASLLAWRSAHPLVRFMYKISAAWLGALNFLVWAACVCWILYGAARLIGLHPDRAVIAYITFGAAVALSIYAIANASWTRARRVRVTLPNLPEAWRGRVAALVSDIHLGHVRGPRFLRRLIRRIQRARPDMVLIAGDLYDGTAADVNRLAEPLRELTAPNGVYYVSGNHEEFTSRSKYIRAVAGTGVRTLGGEKVEIDGVQLVGMHYAESVNRDRFREVLDSVDLDPARPILMLKHSPDRLHMAERAGVSLVLCGHTHGGQFFPFTRITSRIYGEFTAGLNRLGNLLVFTSVGAGTWGPPMRVGPNPEIVLIEFE